MKKYIDKHGFIKAIHNLNLNEEIKLFIEYQGHETEYMFRKIEFIDNIVILYGCVDDFTIGVIQDTYLMTKNEILEELWNCDLSNYYNNRVYIKYE